MKTFIFDLYNTLVEIKTDEKREQTWTPLVGFFAERGIKTDWQTLMESYFNYRKLYLERAVADKKFSFPECDEIAVFESMARGLRGKLTEVDAVLACILMHSSSVERMRLFPGTVELLSALKAKGANIYLLSNAQAVVARSGMQAAGLDEKLFDGIVISSDVGACKPDPAIFEFLFDKYGLDKSDAVMVGDDKQSDIRGADAFGIASVHCYGGAAAHGDEILALAERK